MNLSGEPTRKIANFFKIDTSENLIVIHDDLDMDFGKVEELKAGAAEADRLNKRIYTMMARNCGKKDDYFKKEILKKQAFIMN